MKQLRMIRLLALAVMLCLVHTSQAVTLNQLQTQFLGTGDYSVTADSQTFLAHVNNDGTNAWLLVGRGREGWAWNNAGMGSVNDVRNNLGTTAAFAPTYYSSAIINDLITSSGTNLTDIEIRIRRAADPDGVAYQEYRWRPSAETAWRWNFDTPMAREYEVLSGPGAPFGPSTGGNTRDVCCSPDNGPLRIFTWAWGGHGNVQGFSYGSTVTNGANNGTSFLWEIGNENHAIPYTEVFIRRISAVPIPEPATATLGLLAMASLMRRRRQTA